MSSKSHPHNPTGLSDEAAKAEYDLIHQAELDEQRRHPNDSMTRDPSDEQQSSGNLGSSTSGAAQTLNKMKDTLLGKK